MKGKRKMKKGSKHKEEEVILETENQENVDQENVDQEEVQEIDPLIKLEEEVAAWKDKYLRLQAEFDNFRKRNIKEKADIIKGAGGDVIGELLPIIDDFERAIEVNNNKDEDDVEAIKEGFSLIYNKFKNTLANKGLKAMNAVGEDFNPEFHQAITQIEAGDDMVGKIVDEVEKGYYLNERILRFAKTVIGK